MDNQPSGEIDNKVALLNLQSIREKFNIKPAQ